MIHKVYIVGILIITFIVLICYYLQQAQYQREMDKIVFLELEMTRRNKELDQIRSMTTICPVPNLSAPRDCYINSGYTCSWNDVANRCDLIK